MNIKTLKKTSIFLAIISNIIYFIFMLYVLAKANKGIYIIHNIKSFSLYMVISTTIIAKLIDIYFNNKYDDTTLNKAMEQSLILSILYILKIALENMLFIGGFFVFITQLAKF